MRLIFICISKVHKLTDTQFTEEISKYSNFHDY